MDAMSGCIECFPAPSDRRNSLTNEPSRAQNCYLLAST